MGKGCCATGLGLVLALAACGRHVGSGPAQQMQKAIAVRSVEVRGEPLRVTITAVGTIEPENRVVVAAQEEGLVTALHVREGDTVEAGDVVVELDDRELRAQLAEEKARLVEAESQWGRAAQLIADGLVTQAEADSAKATYQVSKARVEALQTRLSFARITAPVAGVVTVRHVELGDLVAARAPVVELAAGRRVLRVPVSELDVVHLNPGDEAEVSVDALPGVQLPAHVTRIFPAADRTSRQVTVELVLESVPRQVRPGFLARAELVVERISDALMIPEPAIQRGSEIPQFVYVVNDGVAKVRPVRVGARQGGKAQIVEGLAPGEKVVVDGAALLKDGAAVTTAPSEAGA
jgi:membrane fusion protein (multidrug efflux system)